MMETDGFDLKWRNHLVDVFAFVRKLRSKSSYSDVVLHCEGVNFYAHKVILAASSTFFERVLASLPPTQAGVLVMTETTSELLKLLLDFVYDGETFVPSDCFELFMRTAERLGIRGLDKPDRREEAFVEAEADVKTVVGPESIAVGGPRVVRRNGDMPTQTHADTESAAQPPPKRKRLLERPPNIPSTIDVLPRINVSSASRVRHSFSLFFFLCVVTVDHRDKDGQIWRFFGRYCY